jgi:hypothetical protein
MQSGQDWRSDDRTRSLDGSSYRRVLTQSEVRACFIVIAKIQCQNAPQMPFAEDQDVIHERALAGLREPLIVTVRLAREDPRYVDLRRNVLAKLERARASLSSPEVSAKDEANAVAEIHRTPLRLGGCLAARGERQLMFSFRQGLSAGGFVEDRNVVVDYRYAQGQPSRLPLLASDLVRREAAVIVIGAQAALAAKSAGLPCARPRQSFRHPRDP